MAREVDLLVIGAGPGGYPAAIRAAQLGRHVTLVERDRLGGECLNYGCIPSKALIRAGNLVHTLGQAKEWGIDVSGVSVDFHRLQAWKTGVVDRLNHGIAKLCEGNGVTVVYGSAQFTSPTAVDIRTAPGAYPVEFSQAIIATGGRPTDLPAFRFDGKRILSTKEVLELETLPQHLLVIGGGVSGLEIGTFYAKIGSHVTVVEILDQLLPGTDPEIVRIVARNLRALGVAVHTQSQAREWSEADGRLLVLVETPQGPERIAADAILVAVGRRPNTDGLDPDKAGVNLDPKGHVLVDKRMRTSNPNIYATGDVVGPPYLAHKATKEGLIAAEAACGRPVAADYRAMPAAIFTDPEIATVGMTESEAAARGHELIVGRVPFAAIGRALTTGEYDGFVKLIAEKGSKLLLGAQIVGPDASDQISELALAVEMGATVEDIALTVHPHPTLPEGIMESAEAALGRAIHILNR